MSILSQKKSGHHEIQQALTIRSIKPPYSSVSSRGKAARSEINHTPQSGVEIKDECSYTSNPPICLQSMHNENVPFKSVFQRTNQLKKRLVWWVCMNNNGNKWGLPKKYLEFPTRAKQEFPNRAKQKEYQQKKKQIGWMPRCKKRGLNNKEK
jgi:hypothetical protein